MAIKKEEIYEFIANDEDARVCKDISEEACKVVPGNFLLLLIAQFFSKISDAMASTKIVLPWLLNSIGAPAFFGGILVPIRESGSLLPQLVIGGFIRSYKIRKWFYACACFLQALLLVVLGFLGLHSSGLFAGLIITAVVTLFSLARGVGSVASKDVLGKTVPKSRRGRLSGLAASASGGIVVLVGVLLMWQGDRLDVLTPYLIFLAALCFLVAGILIAFINEYGGATDGGGSAFKKALASMAILISDVQFRRFVIARCLLMSSGLVAPYFVMLAQQSASSSLRQLGLFILTSGAASLFSSFLWGKFSDTSSRRVMVIAGVITFAITTALVVLELSFPDTPFYFYIAAFFILSIAHQGVRIGRKTYVVDLAGGNKRTDYVSVSNTVVGIMLLLVGVLSGLLAQLGIVVALLFFAALTLFGIVTTLALKEV